MPPGRARLPPDGRRPGAPPRGVRGVRRRLGHVPRRGRRTIRPRVAAAARVPRARGRDRVQPRDEPARRRRGRGRGRGGPRPLHEHRPGLLRAGVHARGAGPDRASSRRSSTSRSRSTGASGRTTPRARARGRAPRCSSRGARSSPTADPAAAYRRLAAAAGVSLERALELAAAAPRRGYPNPTVGAVVVAADGAIVGEGVSEPAGGRHAEIVALDAAGEAARGATLFVTMEPCAHHGRTPPCVDRIVAAGVARVVAGLPRPEPRGGGRRRARFAPPASTSSCSTCPRPAARTRPGGPGRRAAARTSILKLAVSLDGRVVVPGRRWVTGERVAPPRPRAPRGGRRRRGGDGHRARGRAAPRRARRRASTASRDGSRSAAGRSRTAPSSSSASGPIDDELAALAAEGVQSLLLEGGPTIATSFLAAGLVDRLLVFVAPVIAGERPADARGRFRSRSTSAARRRARRRRRPARAGGSASGRAPIRGSLDPMFTGIVREVGPRRRRRGRRRWACALRVEAPRTAAGLGDRRLGLGRGRLPHRRGGRRRRHPLPRRRRDARADDARPRSDPGDARQRRAGAPGGRAARRPHRPGPRRRRRLGRLGRGREGDGARVDDRRAARASCATASRRARSPSTASRSPSPGLDDDAFSVALVPHTLAATTLGGLAPGMP